MKLATAAVLAQFRTIASNPFSVTFCSNKDLKMTSRKWIDRTNEIKGTSAKGSGGGQDMRFNSRGVDSIATELTYLKSTSKEHGSNFHSGPTITRCKICLNSLKPHWCSPQSLVNFFKTLMTSSLVIHLRGAWLKLVANKRPSLWRTLTTSFELSSQ